MMQTYAEYKDSGVDWLGGIPLGWEEKPVFAVTALKSVTDCADRELLSVYLDRGVIRFSDINEKRTNVTSLDLTNYQAVDPRDFVLNNQQAWRGSVGVSSHTGIVSPAYIVLKLSDAFHAGFANYLFRDRDMVAHYLVCSKGVGTIQRNLYWPKLKRTPLFLPPLPEQTAIAEFLDEKTTKIEALVGIKRRQIELLAERKQILIQNAVTKGLTSDTPMKDSGVNWIGPIPAHWEVKKFRYLFDCWKGLTITKENLQDEGVPCVNYGEIHSKYGFELDSSIHPLKSVSFDYLETSKSALLNFGDFVFADTSEDLDGSGNFTYLNCDHKVFAGYHTVIARPKFNAGQRYTAYFFESLSYRGQMRQKVKGVKVFSITQSILKSAQVIRPPLSEQIEITVFLDKEFKKINAAINIKQNQITKLNEYRTTLINAAVTGKIKVA